LLHALVEQIFLHEPDLAKFSQELTEFEAVPDGKRREGKKIQQIKNEVLQLLWKLPSSQYE